MQFTGGWIIKILIDPIKSVSIANFPFFRGAGLLFGHPSYHSCHPSDPSNSNASSGRSSPPCSGHFAAWTSNHTWLCQFAENWAVGKNTKNWPWITVCGLFDHPSLVGQTQHSFPPVPKTRDLQDDVAASEGLLAGHFQPDSGDHRQKKPRTVLNIGRFNIQVDVSIFMLGCISLI